MIQKYTNIHRIFFVIADLILLNIVYLMVEKTADINFRDFLIINLASNIIWLLSSYVSGAYVIYRQVNLSQLVKKTTIAYLLYVILGVVFIYIFNFKTFTPLISSVVFGFGLLVVVSRLILIAYVVYSRRNGNFYRKVAIIGCNHTADILLESFMNTHSNLRCLGCFDDSTQENTNFNYLGKIDTSLDFCRKNGIVEIYCTLSPEENLFLYELAEIAEKEFIRFRFVPDINKFVNRKLHLDFIDELPVFSLRSEPMNYASAQLKKRIFDIAVSSMVIVFILSWLLPILAIIIKIDSEGSVFFKQKRGGKNNKDFLCIKLRTLKQASTSDGTEVQVKQGDNRLTKIGRILRKTNLDELPQFFNVFMGDMSVVGARPHMLKHDISFATIEEKYLVRMFSKPGVTGWAQINGLRGEIKEDIQLTKRVEFDIWYIENWNAWLDLKIMWLTVEKMISGDKNAY